MKTSLLEETIIRMRVRTYLDEHGVGRMLPMPWATNTAYRQRLTYRTKSAEGCCPEGQRLRRRYKNVSKHMQQWLRDQHLTYRTIRKYSPQFWVEYQKEDGCLALIYVSDQVLDDQEAL